MKTSAHHTDTRDRGLITAVAIGLGLSAYHLVLSMLPGYGFFIDEFYYLACTKHLALGYVDHPPLSIVLLAGVRAVFGDGLTAVRLVPSIALGTTVVLTGLITRRLGGSTLAVAIACLGVAAMPVFLVMGSFYSMNALEILVVATILHVVVRMLDEQEPRYWVLIGVLMGLGLELKHTMGVYAAALALGILMGPDRKLLWNRWVLYGGACAAVLILPNLLWQAMNGFPSLEFYRNAMVNKNIPRSPAGILIDQTIFVNPFALPVWLGGLGFLLFVPAGRKYRSLGLAYLALLAVMIVSQSSRPDRIAAFYPMLFAAGAVMIGSVAGRLPRRVIAGGVIVLLLAGFGLAAPVFSPLLSPERTNGLLTSLGVSLSIESGKTQDPLPQWLGDRLGWEELALEVGKVYRNLPPEEQRTAVIVSNNYGEAGALELYGPRYGLPRVYATHNSYHSWGPPPDSVRTFIGVMVSKRDLDRLFESVEQAGVQTCAFCTRPQQRIPIYVARRPRFLMSKAWMGFRIYS